MKYPSLVPSRVCCTPVHVVFYEEGISEDGEPLKAFEGDFKCNYQDCAKTVLTKEQKQVEITGTAFFSGDIAPKLGVISDGEALVFCRYMLTPNERLNPDEALMPGTQDCIGRKRKILRGTKARNPDGTVNYTKLELI